MLHHQLLKNRGILIITPEGPLGAKDFQELAAEVDPYIDERGQLAGVMVWTEDFPGWEDFGALLAHLRFVRDHHRNIRKVAIVTDSGFASVLPRIVEHFVNADIQDFPYQSRDAALAWLEA
jgi:hypothetical protein